MSARYLLPLLLIPACSVARAAEPATAASTSDKATEHKAVTHHATRHHAARHHAAGRHVLRHHAAEYRAADHTRQRSMHASAHHLHHKHKKTRHKLATNAPAQDMSPKRNPVIEAINLVASKQEPEIRAADRKVSESDWWSDALEREWIVRRPFGPGIFDSTHWFYVSYKVNGRILMSWFVDLRKGTVSDIAPPEQQNGR